MLMINLILVHCQIKLHMNYYLISDENMKLYEAETFEPFSGVVFTNPRS